MKMEKYLAVVFFGLLIYFLYPTVTKIISAQEREKAATELRKVFKPKFEHSTSDGALWRNERRRWVSV